MSRDAALALVLALLALLALGVAAATLDDTLASEGSGFGGGGGEGVGQGTATDNGEADGSLPIPAESRRPLKLSGACITWLTQPWVKATLFLIAFVPAALLAFRARWVIPGLAVFVTIGTPVYVVWAVLTDCSDEELQAGLPSPTNGSFVGGLAGEQAGAGGGGAAETVASQPSIALALLLAVAIAGAVILLFASTGDDEEPATPEEPLPDESEVDVPAVGRIAGRAADRIAGEADADNEVYRAWAEMTTNLDVAHPDASTPAEFAEAAEAAGMAPDDVRELTDLFERVRYGTDAPTEDREQRARAALRRIETEYAEPAGDSEASRR